MVFVSPDICYDSPVDGKPITSKQKRQEDLARHNCIEYDPGMRQDFDRRVIEDQARLEKGVEASVEEVVSSMPARKREKLTAEIQSGLTPEPVRQTRSA